MRSFFTFLLAGVIASLLLFGAHALGLFTVPDSLFSQWVGGSGGKTLVAPSGLLALGILIAFGLAWVAVDIPSRQNRLVVAGSALVLLFSGAGVMALYEVVFSPITPAVGLCLGFFSGGMLMRVGPGARRRKLEGVFGRTLNSRLQSEVFEGMGTIRTHGQRSEASVVEIHLGNSAELMREMRPEDFTRMVGVAMNTAADFLVETGGFLDAGSGQSLRVVFGQPVEDSSHAQTACRAVVGLLQRIDKINLEADGKWHHVLDLHVGISSGEVVAGFFGPTRTKPFTVAGDAVDFAQRLAEACSHYGSRVLIDPETFRDAQDSIEVRPVDLIRSPENPDREIYELIGPRGCLSPERKRSRDRYWRGVILTRERKWDEALEEFTAARIKGIPDGPLDYYLHRIEREKPGKGDNPQQSARELVSL
jgi:class 3 adenylate cyclase